MTAYCHCRDIRSLRRSVLAATLFIALLHSSILRAQSYVIDSFDTEIRSATHNLRISRLFVGRIEIEKWPIVPLSPVDAKVTLKLVRPIKQPDSAIRELRILSDSRKVQVSDSIFVWHGLKSIGDEFSFTFSFIPLMAGMGSIQIAISPRMPPGTVLVNPDPGIGIRWCLNDDGTLLRLTSIDNEGDCPAVVPTYFFNKDSVVLRHWSQTEHFRAYSVIKPVPRIGDTSFVEFKLWHEAGDSLQLDTVHFESASLGFMSKPALIDNLGTSHDPTVCLRFAFVPRLLLKDEDIVGYGIPLVVHNEFIGERDVTTLGGMIMVFRSDSSLMWVSGEGLWIPENHKYWQSRPIKDSSEIDQQPVVYDYSIPLRAE